MDSNDSSTFNPTGPAFPIADNTRAHGFSRESICRTNGKSPSKLTANFGARFDVFNSSFDKENQVSPRVNLIYQPTDSTTLHAGYSRYFTPPPVEDVSQAQRGEISTARPTRTGNDTGQRASRPSARIISTRAFRKKSASICKSAWTAIIRHAKNQLDDGLFGQSLILSAFNYAKGEIYGAEFTGAFNIGGFSTYANVAYSVAKGEDWNSAQFLFGPDGPGTDLAYVRNHWIYLDHDQDRDRLVRRVVSRGTNALAPACGFMWMRFMAAVCGRMRRRPARLPNGATVPAYYSVNLRRGTKLQDLQGQQI